MLKKITVNTAMFGGIIAFVNIFAAVFGSKNSIVGVTVLMSILVLMQKDLSRNPVRNLIKLVSLNLGLGAAAHVAGISLWSGLVINFAAMAGLGYFLSFDLEKTAVVPFGLQYLFMLYAPVGGEDLVKRFAGLALGAVLVMLVQIAFRKKEGAIYSENSEGENSDKVRWAYAIRIGILTAISAFIVEFLNLSQGRWIVYSVFAITELYSECCKQRSLERLQGTAIGATVALLLFTIIESDTARTFIMLFMGYMDMYTRNYRDKIICVTVSVLASASLSGDVGLASIERLFYVAMGVGMALLANKFIFESKSSECGSGGFESVSV